MGHTSQYLAKWSFGEVPGALENAAEHVPRIANLDKSPKRGKRSHEVMVLAKSGSAALVDIEDFVDMMADKIARHLALDSVILMNRTFERKPIEKRAAEDFAPELTGRATIEKIRRTIRPIVPLDADVEGEEGGKRIVEVGSRSRRRRRR